MIQLLDGTPYLQIFFVSVVVQIQQLHCIRDGSAQEQVGKKLFPHASRCHTFRKEQRIIQVDRKRIIQIITEDKEEGMIENKSKQE
mmetsp:Transcript_9368/g.10458  ORF Transcript_9368/g.10458 Transcript_9368/m.10458 type:complete len:86 (-) Transcript_9368:552-809(-)